MTPLETQIGGSHYKSMAIQPAEFATRNKLTFLEGCVVKRVCRHRVKNGAEDIRKAIHELNLILEMEYAQPGVVAEQEAAETDCQKTIREFAPCSHCGGTGITPEEDANTYDDENNYANREDSDQASRSGLHWTHS